MLPLISFEEGFSVLPAGGTNLPSYFTYTGGNGTYFNSASTLTPATTNVARYDYNPATLALRGLLVEGTRSNFTQNASDPSTATFDTTAYTTDSNWLRINGTVSFSTDTKFGSNEIVTFTESTAVGAHVCGAPLGVAVGSTATYTASVFAKAGTASRVGLTFKSGFFDVNDENVRFDLSNGTVLGAATYSTYGIMPAGDGWYLLWVAASRLAGTGFRGVVLQTLDPATSLPSSFAGTSRTFQMVCPMRELGSFPTSFIANTGVSTTVRSTDLLTITNLANIGFNATEGTVVVEFELEALVDGQRMISVYTNLSNRIEIMKTTGSSTARFFVASGGATQFDVSNGTLVVGRNKIAFRYRANDFAVSCNGSAPTVVGSGSVPPVTTLRIGGDTAGANSLFGWASKVTYYPTGATNAALQAYTT